MAIFMVYKSVNRRCGFFFSFYNDMEKHKRKKEKRALGTRLKRKLLHFPSRKRVLQLTSF